MIYCLYSKKKENKSLQSQLLDLLHPVWEIFMCGSILLTGSFHLFQLYSKLSRASVWRSCDDPQTKSRLSNMRSFHWNLFTSLLHTSLGSSSPTLSRLSIPDWPTSLRRPFSVMDYALVYTGLRICEHVTSNWWAMHGVLVSGQCTLRDRLSLKHLSPAVCCAYRCMLYIPRRILRNKQYLFHGDEMCSLFFESNCLFVWAQYQGYFFSSWPLPVTTISLFGLVKISPWRWRWLVNLNKLNIAIILEWVSTVLIWCLYAVTRSQNFIINKCSLAEINNCRCKM